jgi:hypothetical protein
MRNRRAIPRRRVGASAQVRGQPGSPQANGARTAEPMPQSRMLPQSIGAGLLQCFQSPLPPYRGLAGLHHQRLLDRIAQPVSDRRLLALVRRMLTAGVVMPDGTKIAGRDRASRRQIQHSRTSGNPCDFEFAPAVRGSCACRLPGPAGLQPVPSRFNARTMEVGPPQERPMTTSTQRRALTC